MMPGMPIAEGAEFAGYRIVRRLGSGGMGEVYLVQHPRLPRLEALKVLPANVSADPEFRQRFEREADVAASLWHPHIVSVHDRGEHDGQLWITMDYVDGTDVARLLRERYPGGMPANEALEIISAVAEALDYAYERQLLHRDVKPANILVAESRSARRIALADFGIAKMANETHGLTATNMTIGSVAYAAPEQLTGAHLDGRADQYALACTAFHMLTGRPPFADQNPAAVIGKQLSEPPPPLGGLRPDLVSMEPVLARAMAKDPVQRFGSCREFAAALRLGEPAWAESVAPTRQAPAASPPSAPPSSTPPPPAPPPPAPPAGVPAWSHPPRPSNGASPARVAAFVGIGVAALLAVVLVVFVGIRLMHTLTSSPTAPARTVSAPEPTWPTTRTTPTTTSIPRTTAGRPGSPPSPRGRGPGDLGLPTPISSPACDGSYIVVLGSVTTPGGYAEGVQKLLNAFPGASYLRTDESCPSLRPRDDKGNVIYAVYRYAGRTQSELCAALRSAPSGSYGKRLDYTSDPNTPLRC